MNRAHPYIPNTAPAAKAAMLAATGAADVAEFYADIPADQRLGRPLELPPALPSEAELVRAVQSLHSRNQVIEAGKCFLGQGSYRHNVPAVVDEVISRSEFLTAYAGEPYEDHGRFQALFEYESLLAEVLALDVVTVPTYDGFQAMATALSMAGRITGRKQVILAGDVDPGKLSKARDYIRARMEITEIATLGGTADLAAVQAELGGDTAAVWVDVPSFTGAIEPALAELAQAAHAVGALLVVGVDPVAFGVLEPPASFGADIVAGDLQSLGLHPYYGGAHAGFLAVRDDTRFVMELPSRLFGLESTSVAGEYGFGDVAYERTSFALREDGKEWVGTAAALWAIAAGVHLALLGPKGLVELGEVILNRTRYAQLKLAAVDGVQLCDDALHFREFAIDVKGSAAELAAKVRAASGIHPGIPIGEHRLLVCVTEENTAADIDALASAIEGSLK